MKSVIRADFVGRQIVGRGPNSEGLSADGIVNKTESGVGRSTPRALRNREINVFDIYGDAAVAKLMLRESVHYMQLARADGKWKIIGDSVVEKFPH